MNKKPAKPKKASAPAKKKTRGAKKATPAVEKEARKVVAEIVDEREAPAGPAAPADGFDEEDASPAPTRALAVPTGERGLATTDPMALYLNEVRRFPVLTREQEQEIARKYYDTKDPEAAQALVKANLRFVIKIAAEYSKFGAKMIDLIQEGNVGLMHAVREFNPYKGTRLITYAVWWIRGYIQEYLMRQYSLVRIGTTQTQRKLFYQLQKQREQLEALGHNPDFALLSHKLGVSEEEVSNMAQRLTGRDVSLDRPVDEDSDTRLGDLQKDGEETALDDRLAQAEQLALLKEKIDDLRPQLNDREKILLEERLLADEPLTLQEIGEKYGITREAVRQAEARLMKKIKEKMESRED